MLKNVIGDYLDNISERGFDLSFSALLRSQGFFDIHFTHGVAEFGKDFIAKMDCDGETYQYSFQLKAGDINQSKWRNDIQGQLLEALLTGLSHPNFDQSVPHITVLVITGRLTGNAPIAFQHLNQKINNKYQLNSVLLWDREILIQKLTSHGLNEFYSTTSSGYVGYGDFHILYGKSIDGYISMSEIENHSRVWLSDSIKSDRKILYVTLESELISQNCVNNGYYYEGIIAQLSGLRALLHEINNTNSDELLNPLLEILDLALIKIRDSCFRYIDKFREEWIEHDKKLAILSAGSGNFITYLVNCARVLEISGFLFFLLNDPEIKKDVLDFLLHFVNQEPGCAHIPGDKYAVSLVFPVLAMKKSGFVSEASELLKQTTIWLCDRFEKGFGIADFEASPFDEIKTLFGYPYEFVEAPSFNDCFLATIISDLSAYIENQKLYHDIINDIQAVNIFPTYWQIPDSNDLFIIEGRSIISYPSVRFFEDKKFGDYDYADHIIHEENSFVICEKVNTLPLLSLMLLLRDRYFPTLWKHL